jgi:renalase
VLLLDKARGPGGRMSTRRGTLQANSWDHGAQYFTARDARFQADIARWQAEAVVAEWQPRLAEYSADGLKTHRTRIQRFVALPGQNALLKHLHRELTVQFDARVTALSRSGETWTIQLESGIQHSADQLVLAIPAAQAAALLTAAAKDLASELASIHMQPCLALMLAFAAPIEFGYDGVFVNHGSLSWIARDSSKPGRSPGERFVVHAGPEFSAALFAAPDAELHAALWQALQAITGTREPPVEQLLMRWRYALGHVEPIPQAWFDASRQLGVCGDYLHGGRVEGAYLSGLALAERLLV